MDSLVADTESSGNLAHRCACQVQASDRSTVFGLGSFELVFELSDPTRRGGRFVQELLIYRHLSTIYRQRRLSIQIDRKRAVGGHTIRGRSLRRASRW